MNLDGCAITKIFEINNELHVKVLHIGENEQNKTLDITKLIM